MADPEMTKVLIVEDDPYLGMMMKECFEDRGFAVRLAADGELGFGEFSSWHPQVCILDVMMPHKDGFTLAEQIREADRLIPFLFTTARSLKADVLRGFEVGADDYIKKPFSMEELIARVQVVLRRARPAQTEPVKEEVIQLGEYLFNHHRHTLTREGIEKKLTNREAELLHLFCLNANRTIDRTHTLQSLWGDDSYFNARSMDVFVSRLRKLLKHDPNIELVNVRGKGYKLLIWDH